jgi:hypothetical protein
MADEALRPASPNRPADNGRLDSWKEIAAYLKRDVTTVRRWEKREGLPVHRHLHERRDSVYAYVAEIDTWWEGRRNRLSQNGAAEAGPRADSANHSDVTNPAGGAPIGTRARWAWMLAATFFVTTVALGVLLLTREAGTAAETAAIQRRFAVHPPTGMTFRNVVVSPDGRHLAFTAVPNDVAPAKARLWVQPLDSLEAHPLPDTDDASFPFWAPTSDALGFFAEGRLWTIDIAGAGPRPIAVALDGRGGTWNRQGTIVFAPGRASGLLQVPSSGGTAAPLTRLSEGAERAHLWPQFLPDGNHFLYLAEAGNTSAEDHHVYAGSLAGDARRRVLSVRSTVAYSATGHLIYQYERSVVAQPFDAARLEATGEPVALMLEPSGFRYEAEYSVSSNGVLTYRTPRSSATRLIWRDRAGVASALLDTPADYYDPTLSPDETRIAYQVFDPKPSDRYGFGPARIRGYIHVVDRATGQPSRLTSSPEGEWEPVWSPDGRSMVFAANRRSNTALFLKDVGDPDAVEVPVPSVGLYPWAQSWSPDGRFVVYSARDATTKWDLYLVPMSGDRTPIPLARSAFNERRGQISPDGRWLAYTSDESGRSEVYVTTFPMPTAKWPISTTGAGDPRWRPDGAELFFVTEDRQLMAVAVKAGTGFAHGAPVRLFDTGIPPDWNGARNTYDVGRDGRFLFMTPVEDGSAPVTLVLNWTARLARSY